MYLTFYGLAIAIHISLIHAYIQQSNDETRRYQWIEGLFSFTGGCHLLIVKLFLQTVNIPGKGKGVIATKQFHKGDYVCQ